ncbi:apolipoprotein N-acyltransferase [Scytonema sp. PRP1]|uniref:apolipoprotein N-acyltransferase n=1 Tax=Scytonema sp. PRP1 TaxID=3120513 RepID=UPI00300D03AB
MTKPKFLKLNLKKRLSQQHPLIIVLASGVLMGLAPAPLSFWVLAWVALVPLWILTVKLKSSFKALLLQGLVWGAGYHGLALFWITGIHPMTWMGVNWWVSLAIALFCWVFITLWGAVLVALWAGIFGLVCRSLSQTSNLKIAFSRVLIGTTLWCSLESFWSQGPLWWSSLSYTQSPFNLSLLHLGQISGPLTVTAAIIAVNAWIAEAWINRKTVTRPIYFNHKYLCIAAGTIITLHLIGFTLYNHPLAQPPESALRVGIIQGNIPNEVKLYEEGWQRALKNYTKGYQILANQGVDAVLTPEVALPLQWTERNRVQNTFYQTILKEKVVAWVGAFGTEGERLTNSLFTVAANGQTLSEYRKVKLVPLGEYIPFEQWLGKFMNRLSPLKTNLIAGQSNQTFDTPFGRVIVGICYESAFAEHFRAQAATGGQFILTASNNAHYSPAMPAQHHAQDVMRAIESDRWTVRATNTGYSGIVDPHGRTLWRSNLNTYELHIDTIYRRSTQTLYVRWGDWLTPLLAVAGLIAWLLDCFKRNRNLLSHKA